ncbi:MAG: caspase family protein [Muribaculaceae bacterium]|nr:caspase family protein [Muribaculaceae bacterium]
MKKIYLPILNLGTLAASYAVLSVASAASLSSPEVVLAEPGPDGKPADSGLRTDPDAVADTVPLPSPAELKGEEAAGLYKGVKFMLYEGELESNLYPAAIEADRAAVEALSLAESDEQRERAASILLDLDPLMAQGAVYFSQQSDQQRQAEFARACIDARNHPLMAGRKFDPLTGLMPQLLYCAAYGATASGDTEAAKGYFRQYLDSGDASQRQNVVKYYGQACLATGDYRNGLNVLSEGAAQYPADIQILTLALQTCLDGGLTDSMQPLLDKALALSPNDEKLLNLQAQLHERNGEYAAAVDILQRLLETHPNSLELYRSLATCYYNLGASHYNSSIMESDEKTATRHRRQSRTYFNSAANALGHVLANTPSDMKYLTALAHTYASLGEKDKFEETNRQIRAFGGNPVAFNSMPQMIGSASAAASGEVAAKGDVPSFDEFAAPYITSELGAWARRGEFEKIEDYRRRMAGGEAEQKYETLLRQAEKDYLDRYASQLLLTDMRLQPYDVEHETYRIDTPYGETVVKVPLKDHEAEAFKAGWEGAQLRAPRYMIRDGKVALASVTYVVGGRKYEYSAADAAGYSTPRVYVDMAGILGDGDDAGSNANSGPAVGIFKDSDVDVNIPVTGRKSVGTFALVIANERYAKADNVYGALHDGDTFARYCASTLGVPQSNIIAVNDATGNEVRDALSTLSRKVKGYGPEAEVIVYYAGHGLPDESNGEAYMMPVDANPMLPATLIPMSEIYSTLGALPSAATSVFVDACFSGTDRSGEMINKARGVVFATRPAAPEGNMFVLTAASSKETALPYKEKYHGLFTYWLLKKLQESKGNATLKQIAEYVISNVRNTAESVNGKPQNPTVSTSGRMATEWDSKKLKP